MWDELGIAPCDDPKAIRRAYAARLKALDPDRDPAGFARLRQAFEWALGRTAGGARPYRPPEPSNGPRRAPPQPPRRPAAIEERPRDMAPGFNRPISTEEMRRASPLTAQDETRDRELIAALDRALRRHRAAEAIALFDRASANGVLSLEDAPDMLWRVFEVAATDASLDGVVFRRLIRSHGWDTLGIHTAADRVLHGKVNVRLAAEDWYDERVAAANRRNPSTERYLARLMLKRAGRFFTKAKSAKVRAMLADYRVHEAILGQRIDRGWVAQLERRLRRREIARLTLICGVLVIALYEVGAELWLARAPPTEKVPGSVWGIAVLVVVLLFLVLAAQFRRLYRLVVPLYAQASLRSHWNGVLRRWSDKLRPSARAPMRSGRIRIALATLVGYCA